MYWLCWCVASCNQYLMLINHPTDGATRGLTLMVRLLGRKIKIKIWPKKLLTDCSLIRSNTVYYILKLKISSSKAAYVPLRCMSSRSSGVAVQSA